MKKVNVKIEDISYEGAGVGRADGKVVFVPKTLVGEEVEAVVTKETTSFAIGQLSGLLKPNSNRIEPACPYFAICGGCDFQHCSYKDEVEIKKELVKEEFAKIEIIEGVEFEPSEDRLWYRNKIKLEVENGKIGYYKNKSHDFFEITSCPIATKEINSMLPIIKEFIFENKFVGLKSVYVKQVEKKLAVCLLFLKNAKKQQKNIKKLEKFDKNSVFFAYGDVLEDNKTEIYCLYGEGKLTKKIAENNIEIDVGAFNQINSKVASKMYDDVLKLVDNKRVINAYSGQGLLTYLIAQKAKFVYGIEYQKSAHLAAEKLKELISDYKIENVCGKVEENIGPILLRDKIDLIVLDPARKGCQKEVLDSILGSGIDEIIYISCKYSTQVRDIKILKEKYKIDSVKIFDMFPNASNVETMVFLRKKS